MPQEGIFPLKEPIILAWIGLVEHTRLPEEHGFDLRTADPLLLDITEGKTASQPLEGVIVDTETKTTCQGDVAYLVPIALIMRQEFQEIG